MPETEKECRDESRMHKSVKKKKKIRIFKEEKAMRTDQGCVTQFTRLKKLWKYYTNKRPTKYMVVVFVAPAISM